MKLYLMALFCIIVGCTPYAAVYNDVSRYQQSRDSERCIAVAKYHLDKGHFSDNEKSELYQILGVCFGQIGFYDDAKNSFGMAVDLSTDNSIKAKAYFNRAILLLSLDSGISDNGRKFIDDGCSDLSEACKLMPEKYCSEYSIKKYPPTNCK
jgi:tetratricopeptide (TPR) repeat protein